MLKNLSIGLLAGLLFVSQTGIRVDIHACGEEEAIRFLGLHFGIHCSCPDWHHDTPNDCCDDEELFVKAATSHWIGASGVSLPDKADFIASLPPLPVLNHIIPVIDHAPPPDGGLSPPGRAPALFLLNCIFRL